MDTKCENVSDKPSEYNKWILMIKFNLRPILNTFNGFSGIKNEQDKGWCVINGKDIGSVGA